ncbi:MAG: imelysin family protein [Campylobacterota bacterium]
MKKLFLGTLILVTSSFAQTNLHSILKNVSIPNVNKSIEAAKQLKQNPNAKNFTKLVKNWKKVEAMYFAGNMDDNYIDTPRYIDVYHNLKEDLHKQMKRALESDDKPRIALFKNSFRTINALEYVLFNDDKITKREKLFSKMILDTIISNLEDIKNVYENYYENASKTQKWENSMIMNTLISSSYKLREWRIGEPAGLAVKYEGDKDNSRAEYYLSKNSKNAIEAILKAHEEIIGEKDYKNFATMAKKAGAIEATNAAQKALKATQEKLYLIKNDDFSNAKELFFSAKSFHNAYYLSLITDLSITAKILDADGD